MLFRSKPQVALRVMVAHAICGSPLWKVDVQNQRNRNEAVTQSIETSVAEAQFDERRRAILEVLGFDAEAPSVVTSSGYFQTLDTVFARLLELPDPVVMEIMAVAMAETLAAGSELIETLGVHLKVDMADYWVADDAFYGLIRDREVLTHILGEVGGGAVAQAHSAEKAKTIKSVINDFLTGEKDRTKIDRWVPRWMAFPPSAYTTRGGVATVANANRAAWNAEIEEPSDPNSDAPAHAQALLIEGNVDAAAVMADAKEQRLAA